MKEKNRIKRMQWHPGFVAAMNLELVAQRNEMIMERERNLNLKPLEIDLLVIKKNRETKISNEIGRKCAATRRSRALRWKWKS